MLRAHAFVLGRDAVTEDDLMFLEHVLWKDPEERPKVGRHLRRIVKGYEEEARELLYPEPGAARIRRGRDGRARSCATAR